jgi:hypothetical protein
MARGALGVYLDGAGNTVVVAPTTLGATQASDFAPPGATAVRLQATDFTPTAWQGLHDELIAFASQAKVSFGFYLDLKTSKVVLQTEGAGTQFAPLMAKYPGRIDLQSGATGGQSANRGADTWRFWGGAYSSGVNQYNENKACTTGFEAHSGSYYYLNSAGHCYKQGSTVRTGGSGASIGYVSSNQWPTWEIAWIYGSGYSPVIYNGLAGDNSSSANVYGRKYAWVGQSGYCATGWATGRLCPETVTSTSASFISYDHGAVHVTDNLYAYSGPKFDFGDSGGPVYYPYNGGALIAGTVVGFYDIGLGNTNYSTKAAETLAHWGLEVVCVGTCVIQP